MSQYARWKTDEYFSSRQTPLRSARTVRARVPNQIARVKLFSCIVRRDYQVDTNNPPSRKEREVGHAETLF